MVDPVAIIWVNDLLLQAVKINKMKLELMASKICWHCQAQPDAQNRA